MLKQVKEINPKMVMLYPIARATPVHYPRKIPVFELEKIAEKVRSLELKRKVYQ